MSEAEALLAIIDGHHITDRALLRARDRARRGEPGAVDALQREMRRYFGAVAAESEALLAQIDRKLDDLYQRQYNLQAERGVAERRLAGARGAIAAAERSSDSVKT